MTKVEGLQGKRALVTGAAGAIGSAVARELMSSGVHVYALDRSEDRLSSLKAEGGDSLTMVAVDLSDLSQINDFCDEFLSVERGVDIIINNAGVLTNNKLDETTVDEINFVFKVNLTSAYMLCKGLVPEMRKRGWGRIINICSFAWKTGGLTAGNAYCMSKAAMVGMTFTLARELASNQITANGIAPAYVLSPMVREELSAEQRQKTLSSIPVGRFCDAEEVAHAVGFLASPRSGFITGEIIDMNGGLQFG